MKFYGIQKLSMVDYDGKLCCTIFTGGCNMLCPYCHNSDLVFLDRKNIEPIDESEILDFLDKRKNMLDAVCITGGEALLHKDLINFIIKVKKMGYLIKIDTNGTNPKVVENLIFNKLIDYVALDIKNSKELYAETIGLKSFNTNDISETLNILRNSNIEYEIRTTLVDKYHNISSIESIGKWLNGEKKLFLQKFYDSGKCIKDNLKPIDYNMAIKFRNILEKYIDSVKLRGY